VRTALNDIMWASSMWTREAKRWSGASSWGAIVSIG
jgi:hypothetical protein